MVLVWCGVYVCGGVVFPCFLFLSKVRVSNAKIMDFGEVYTFMWKTQLQSAVFWACIIDENNLYPEQRE